MRSIADTPPARFRSSPRGEEGFALIEVVVSAVVVILIAIGALSALEATARTGAEERHRAQAHGVAQQDQARLRGMRVSDLANIGQSRTITVDATPYTIVSKGEFVTDSTGTASCSQGTASADYIKITSTVTWPSIGSRPPVALASIIAPPNGSISPDRGALAVSMLDSRSLPLAGIGISGTGPGSFNGTTAANGCVIYGDLPQGNYTVTTAASGMVDKDGVAPQPQTTSVVGFSTNTLALQYDRPGTINASFRTRVGTGSPVAAATDQIMVYNTGMTSAKAFGTLGTRVASISTGPLFPFTSPDAVYAGSCTGNTPTTGSLAVVNATVPVGGTVTPAPIELPALNLTAFNGTGSSSPGTRANGANVLVLDDNCSVAGKQVRRTFTTNSSGNIATIGTPALQQRGLPWSRYDVCVDNGTKRVVANNIDVKNLTSGTTLNLYLGSSGAVAGTCAQGFPP